MQFLNFSFKVILVGLFLLILLPACKPKTNVLKSPPHYNFAEVFTYKLDLKLKEISGVVWDSDYNEFLAINDESGKLFYLDKESKSIIGEFSFGDRGDYEDVAIFKGNAYILRSDGMITKFIKGDEGKNLGIEVGKLPVTGSNDFETMYADSSRNALVIICKNCSVDDAGSVSAFAFYPETNTFETEPLFVINADRIKELSPVKTSKFQPSAAAIHPVLNKLFILSAASHQLVTTDLNGNVETVHYLSPKLFPQAEGITFKNNGDMYISNEGITSKSTLLKFNYYAESADETKTEGKFNLTIPDEKMELGKHLKEISGMAYIPGSGLILAENDEKGDIFTIDFANKKDLVGKVKFGGKGDYEDIVYTDTAIYMLVSSGSVIRVSTIDSSFVTNEYELGRKGTNEFESMYLDADGNSLILLCKDCSKEKNEVRNAYRFDISTKQFSEDPVYTIEVSEIQRRLSNDGAEFKPSAAGINPVNGKLYIIASVGKVLVIANKAGIIEEVIKLDPVLYNQPEGITFAPNGDMYISNEAGDRSATILKFNYKK